MTSEKCLQERINKNSSSKIKIEVTFMDKLVTVIITTYARPDNIVRAIRSVQAQTYKNIEIIVVDDNGLNTQYQKETEDILKEYIANKSILYIPHDVNKNGSAARNTGLRASHGDFINFMDDDDTFMPTKISKQIEVLENHPEHGACYCNGHILGGRRNNFDQINDKEGNLIADQLSCKVRFNTTTVLFRRNVIEDLNGWDESFIRHQDWELFVRFYRKYTIGIVYGDPLICKYRTPNAITRNPYKSIEYKEKFLSTFKDDIDRQKEAPDIYKFQYFQLAHTLIGAKYRKEGMKYVKKANSYKRLTLHEWIIVCRSYAYSIFK